MKIAYFYRTRIFLSALLLQAPSAIALGAAPSPARQYGVWQSAVLGGGGYLQQLSMCRAAPERIYLASDVGGVYRSDDAGAHWRMLHGALPPGEASYQVRGVLVHPEKPDLLLLATGMKWEPPRGVYRSEDGGEHFELVLPGFFDGSDDFRADGSVLLGSPLEPDTVYAAPVGKGVYRSTDFGKTWESLNLPGIYASGLVADRCDARKLWVVAVDREGRDASRGVTRAGLFYTEDAGAHWQLVNRETPREFLQDPVDPGLLHGLFRTSPQLRYSSDAGRTWQAYAKPELFPAPKGPREDGTYAAIAAGPDFVVVGAHGGTFYRLDCGSKTWERLPAPKVVEGNWFAASTQPIEKHFGSALGFLTIFPEEPEHWLFTDWYACYATHDAGKTWTLAIDGIELTVAHCLAQDPKDPKRVHAGFADVGYFRSDDAAASFGTWGRLRGLSNNIKQLAVCATRPEVLYAVGPATWQWRANQSFCSTNAGTSWQRLPQRGLPKLDDSQRENCNSVAVHPAHPNELYLTLSGAVEKGKGGVYRSTDYGASWEAFSEGLPQKALFRRDIWGAAAELAVAGDGSLVALSHDAGLGFYRAPNAQRWIAYGSLPGKSSCVVADPSTNGVFYAAFGSSGVYVSEGGMPWRACFVPPEGESATCVAVDLAQPQRLAVSTGTQVYFSADRGTHWQALGPGLPFRHGRNVLCFAGEKIVVATGGSGVFSTPIPASSNP